MKMLKIGGNFISGVMVGFEIITNEQMDVEEEGFCLCFDLLIFRVLIHYYHLPRAGE